MDAEIGLHMAYWGSLSSSKTSQKLFPKSSLKLHADRRGKEPDALNVSMQAWRALASASEQAGFAEHARYITGGGIVERPQTSLARSVLLGSARTIFLLQPESCSEQIVRAARLANQEARDLRNAVQNWNNLGIANESALDSLSEYANTIAADAAKTLSGAGLNPQGATNDTDILKTTFGLAVSDDAVALTMLMEFWNRASGVTHARGWPWSVYPPDDPLTSFLGAWTIPCKYLEAAWNLWNDRRGASSIPACPPPDWEPDRNRWGLAPGCPASTLQRLRYRVTLNLKRRFGSRL